MSDVLIRDVRPEDAERLVEIYAYYILDTAVSFEYEVPSISEFTNRIEKISRKYPYLVCEIDGKVVGYVYAGTYSGRAAYNWTVTTSIYLDKEYRRHGIGTMLYKELEERLKKQGIINLLAGVAYCEEEDEYLTHDSIKFHTEQGYKKVAHMETVGRKFDRWYDLIWMQKKIGEV
ncbi:MAG: N-acetyltransferase [Eubacterium sp.]|nr:N-acetyltransferase [Eubacterium sp.]